MIGRHDGSVRPGPGRPTGMVHAILLMFRQRRIRRSQWRRPGERPALPTRRWLCHPLGTDRRLLLPVARAGIKDLSGSHGRTSVRSVPKTTPQTKPGELLNMGSNLAGAALQLVGRLRDHIERLDDGRAYAADDLAVVLRCLLCSGKGNRVLMRVTQTDGLTVVPRVRLSRPAPDDDDVFFAVGSIPVEEPGAAFDGATEATLTKWMNRRVLTVTSAGSRTTYTWDRFLSTYAEKWGGAHLDEVVPPHLRMIDDHAVGGLPLSNYLLRMAAVAAWHAAQQLLGEVFKDVVTKSQKASNANLAEREARRHFAVFRARGRHLRCAAEHRVAGFAPSVRPSYRANRLALVRRFDERRQRTPPPLRNDSVRHPIRKPSGSGG